MKGVPKGQCWRAVINQEQSTRCTGYSGGLLIWRHVCMCSYVANKTNLLGIPLHVYFIINFFNLHFPSPEQSVELHKCDMS